MGPLEGDEVVRVELWGMGLVSYQMKVREFAHIFLPCETFNKNLSIYNPEEGHHPNLTMVILHLNLDIQALKCEQYI